MHKLTLATAAFAVMVSSGARALELDLTFEHLWTFGHTRSGQVSEIPAYDAKTNTVWVAGVAGVEILDAATGAPVGYFDVAQWGNVNSVAIHDGLAALAVEAVGERRNPGVVLFVNTRTRALTVGINEITVGSLPDMLVFTHDGRKLLVANEGTPNARADAMYSLPDPPGSVTIIDVARRKVIATAGLAGVPTVGDNVRAPIPGMDFEPEYIAVSRDGSHAWVTLQEGNAIGVLDVKRGVFTRVIGLGAKDFNAPGNKIDPRDDTPPTVLLQNVAAKGLYMPDSIATYEWFGIPLLVMANEGDFREDNADRSAAGSSLFNAAAPLDRLRVSNRDSSAGNLFAAGARSFSIRGPNGGLIYDSGDLLDTEAHARGIYDDGRSRDKGVEPEGIALLDLGWRTYAFVGLERTTQAAVAVFDISNPWRVRYLDMIVTPGNLAPEGLAVYRHGHRFFLAIANETLAPGASTTNTTVYEIGFALSR